MMIKVYAPASIGNVSVGFDVLGAAISPQDGSLLGDCVSVEEAEQFSLNTHGRFVDKLPKEPQENIVYQCWQRYCEVIGRKLMVAMVLEKNMPIGSGLGSSACSVVAALMALNTYAGQALDKTQLLLLMGEMEGKISGSVHYDNVAPCYLGGLQLILEEPEALSQRIPGFDDWYWVMAYPGINVSTAQARTLLPSTYRRQDCITHGRNLAGFIYACHTQQPSLAAKLMQDVVAEPYRMCLLPGFAQARQKAQAMGALACGISGSGPTLFAVCDTEKSAQQVAQQLASYYLQNTQGFVCICRLDSLGARLLLG